MPLVIQYYAETLPGDELPDNMQCVEMPGTLAEVKAHAARSTERGAPFAWAEAYEIMDYKAFGAGSIADPAVASWSRRNAQGS
jgi:hypothetical protein